ncbi:unnamed protein product, partial [Urochloa humidicola]
GHGSRSAAALPDAAAAATGQLPLGQAPPRSRSPTDAMAARLPIHRRRRRGRSRGARPPCRGGLPARGAAIRGAALPSGGAPATAVFALGSFWRSEVAFGVPSRRHTHLRRRRLQGQPRVSQPCRPRRVRQGSSGASSCPDFGAPEVSLTASGVSLTGEFSDPPVLAMWTGRQGVSVLQVLLTEGLGAAS